MQLFVGLMPIMMVVVTLGWAPGVAGMNVISRGTSKRRTTFSLISDNSRSSIAGKTLTDTFTNFVLLSSLDVLVRFFVATKTVYKTGEPFQRVLRKLASAYTNYRKRSPTVKYNIIDEALKDVANLNPFKNADTTQQQNWVDEISKEYADIGTLVVHRLLVGNHEHSSMMKEVIRAGFAIAGTELLMTQKGEIIDLYENLSRKYSSLPSYSSRKHIRDLKDYFDKTLKDKVWAKLKEDTENESAPGKFATNNIILTEEALFRFGKTIDYFGELMPEKLINIVGRPVKALQQPRAQPLSLDNVGSVAIVNGVPPRVKQQTSMLSRTK